MTGADNDAASIELWVPIKEYAERTGKNVHTITTQVYRKKRESRKGIWNGEEAVLVKLNPGECIQESQMNEVSTLKEKIENLRIEIENLRIKNAVLESEKTFSEREKIMLNNLLHSMQEVVKSMSHPPALQAASAENKQVVITMEKEKPVPWFRAWLPFLAS